MQLLWDGNAKEEDNLTAITINNSTHCHLRLGQADTDESLMIRGNSQLAYVWRSPKARLMLRCSTESAIQTGIWRSSEPFSLREGVIAIRINHDGYVNTLVVLSTAVLPVPPGTTLANHKFLVS